MTYNILASCDNNYIMPCGVMICSVCESNRDRSFCFHIIIDESVTDSSKISLTNIVRKYKANISFYTFSRDDVLKALGSDGISFADNISLPTYYRLFVETILPPPLDKCLYLDCDIVVRGRLDELFTMNLDNCSVGCVPDISEGITEYYERLGYPKELGYFNAGVLLINLGYWRSHHLMSQFVEFYKNHRTRIKQHDQDILNYVCRTSKHILPIKWNAQDGFFLNRCYFDRKKYTEQLSEAEHNPIIVHYTGIKPWEKQCENPFKTVFDYYQDKTEWKGLPLVNTRTHFSLKNKLVVAARKLGIISPKYRCNIKPLIK